MPRRRWRILYYGTYLVLGLGWVHALTIAEEFTRYEPFRIEEPDKVLLAVVAVPLVLLFPIWRIGVAQQLRARKVSRQLEIDYRALEARMIALGSLLGGMVAIQGHPDADAQGYVNLPNVDTVTEMVDMMGATRAYEANVAAVGAVKGMAMKALEIGRA